MEVLMNKKAIVSIILSLAVTALAGCGTPNQQVKQVAKADSVNKKVPYYPLNPLSADEMNLARNLLKENGYIKTNSRFQEITLKEPRKEDVWNWKSGTKLPRQASIIVLQDKKVIEGLVDLDNKKVLSWNEIKDAHGMILMNDWETAQKAIEASDEYKKALTERGIKDIKKVIATPLSVGYFGPNDKLLGTSN
jgi:primary-amine oxidase